MATTQQILNACDEIMKNKIRELLWNFWVTSSEENLTANIEYTTEIFFKIVNMDKKYCRPEPDFPDTIYGYSLFQLKKIINFAKSRNFNPGE